MELLQLSLALTTLLCSLVAGFLFAFTVVVMPGLRSMGDADLIRAFQRMDGVIQNNQPLFMLVWAGSVLAMVASLVLGILQMDAAGLWLLVPATAAYLLGVQLPTGAVNVPLNNRLQSLDTAHMDEAALQSERNRFESRWNRWNRIRTLFSVVTVVLLILLLLEV